MTLDNLFLLFTALALFSAVLTIAALIADVIIHLRCNRYLRDHEDHYND